MARCRYCGENKPTASGCIRVPIIHNGKEFEPIRMGATRMGRDDSYFNDTSVEYCEDCGVARDHYHHPGCEKEICPVCGKQLIFCGCSDKSLSCLWLPFYQKWVYR